MYLPIEPEAWVCGGCGRIRTLKCGKDGILRLRCEHCEGHEGNAFLTQFDHEFLKDGGVKIQAD